MVDARIAKKVTMVPLAENVPVDITMLLLIQKILWIVSPAPRTVTNVRTVMSARDALNHTIGTPPSSARNA